MADFMRSVNAATPGMSRLAMALGGGGGGYQRAYNDELGLQSKLAQVLAQTEESRAKTEAERAGAAMRTPDAIRRNAMVASGIPLDEDQAVTNYFQSGQLGGKYAPAADGMGPVLPEPDWAGKLGDVARSIAGTQRALTIGDKNSENIAKADSIARGDRLSDAIIAGQANRNTVAGAQAAAAGKDLFHADSTGSVLDKFTGALDANNPMAGATIDLRKQQANQARAGAANSYASAGQHKAQAEKIQQEASLERGLGKAPAGYRWSSDGQSLETIPGGPAATKDDRLSEGERKSAALLMRLRGSQQQLLNAVGETPSSEKPISTVELIRRIPLVGEAAANSLTPEARQRVEAAQLDMLDAALTLGTGAAYTREQLHGYAKSYFPQIGDKPKDVADKRVRLANVIRAAELAAGRAASSVNPVVPDGPRKTGGAEGSWDGPTGGNRNITVDY